MQAAIRLFPTDNILVLARSLNAGEEVIIEGVVHDLKTSLGLGHKIAAQKIAAGEKILKYGAPIGSATADIQPGEHVHLHNMKSDYLPTFTLDEGHEFHKHA
jgi:altronate dehydratase small subunit